MHIQTDNESFSTTLEMQDTKIFAEIRKPREKGLYKYPYVVLSSPHEWEPSKLKFHLLNKQSLEEVIADIVQDLSLSALSSRVEVVSTATEDREP